MEFNDLAEKAEAALQAVLRAAKTGVDALQVFTSFEDDGATTAAECLVINCLGGLEDGHGSGNERLSFSIKLRSAADRVETDGTLEEPGGPRTRHRSRWAKICDALKAEPDALALALTEAVDGFTVFPSIEFRRGPSRTGQRKFESEALLTFSCAPSDID